MLGPAAGLRIVDIFARARGRLRNAAWRSPHCRCPAASSSMRASSLRSAPSMMRCGKRMSSCMPSWRRRGPAATQVRRSDAWGGMQGTVQLAGCRQLQPRQGSWPGRGGDALLALGWRRSPARLQGRPERSARCRLGCCDRLTRHATMQPGRAVTKPPPPPLQRKLRSCGRSLRGGWGRTSGR